jgi:hypothetical protein
MSNVHIYDWAKHRGFYGRSGQISHLLLDKGVLCVSDASHHEFLAEYAKGVIRGGRNPCIVEYKTKVFRMFYDLDIVANPEIAERMSRGDFDDDVRHVFHQICEFTAMSFVLQKTRVVLCASNAPKKTKTMTKIGVHLTFGDIFVTSHEAMHVRQSLLERMKGERNPFENGWETIIDSAVFKGSGMRLPWSAKHNEPDRVYVPLYEFLLDRDDTALRETKLYPDVIKHSFHTVRDILRSVCLRSNLTKATPLVDNVEFDCDSSNESPSYISHASLREYETVIEELKKYIPVEYEGKISGVIKGENAFMFRHTSKYCENVGRKHHSSNTYFLVTKSGMRQCCYSRKDEDVGQKYTLCSHFRGETIDIPKHVIDELFPPAPDKIVEIISPPMPSDFKQSTLDFVIISNNASRMTKKSPRFLTKKTRPSKFIIGENMKKMFA